MGDRSRGDGPDSRIEKLYDRFADGLYRYALMILADPAGAADAVQQVFVSLLNQRHQAFESDQAYLKRAVRNECYDTLRRRERDGDSSADGLLEAVGEDDQREERLAMSQAIATLPPEQREVVHLKVFEGMTFQEIADMTGESINTVASRHRYALEKLRAALGVARSVRA